MSKKLCKDYRLTQEDLGKILNLRPFLYPIAKAMAVKTIHNRKSKAVENSKMPNSVTAMTDKAIKM